MEDFVKGIQLAVTEKYLTLEEAQKAIKDHFETEYQVSLKKEA